MQAHTLAHTPKYPTGPAQRYSLKDPLCPLAGDTSGHWEPTALGPSAYLGTPAFILSSSQAPEHSRTAALGGKKTRRSLLLQP